MKCFSKNLYVTIPYIVEQICHHHRLLRVFACTALLVSFDEMFPTLVHPEMKIKKCIIIMQVCCSKTKLMAKHEHLYIFTRIIQMYLWSLILNLTSTNVYNDLPVFRTECICWILICYELFCFNWSLRNRMFSDDLSLCLVFLKYMSDNQVDWWGASVSEVFFTIRQHFFLIQKSYYL